MRFRSSGMSATNTRWTKTGSSGSGTDGLTFYGSEGSFFRTDPPDQTFRKSRTNASISRVLTSTGLGVSSVVRFCNGPDEGMIMRLPASLIAPAFFCSGPLALAGGANLTKQSQDSIWGAFTGSINAATSCAVAANVGVGEPAGPRLTL
jgi:hypothetical protein